MCKHYNPKLEICNFCSVLDKCYCKGDINNCDCLIETENEENNNN